MNPNIYILLQELDSDNQNAESKKDLIIFILVLHSTITTMNRGIVSEGNN